MNKSAFIKELLEIYVNTTLPHPDDSYRGRLRKRKI